MSHSGDLRTSPTPYVSDGNLDISDREDSVWDSESGPDNEEPHFNDPEPIKDNMALDRTKIVFPPNIPISSYLELMDHLKRFKILSEAFHNAFRKFPFF
jgi:hypothetical protein